MVEPLSYRASSSAVYYTAARGVNVGRMIGGTLGAALGIVIGAFAYGMLQPGLESMLTRIGALVAACIATAVLSIVPVRYGRVRSPVVAGTVGALLSLLVLHVMWLAWVHTVLQRMGFHIEWLTLILNPAVLFRIIVNMNQSGVWAMRGHIPRGGELLTYWIPEAGAILASGVLAPIKSIVTDKPICRECGAICKSLERLPRFSGDFETEFIAAIESRDFSAIAAFQPPANEDDPELSLHLVSCPRCGVTNVLTVSRIAWHVDEQGRAKVISVPLVNQLLVTSEEADAIRFIGKEIAQGREEQKTEGLADS